MKNNLFLPRVLDLQISFILRNNYANKKGEHPIVLRLQYRGERKDVNTGLTVKLKDWISGSGCVATSSKFHQVINKHLQDIAHMVKDSFEKMKFSLGEFSLDELIERVKGKDTPPETLMEYINKRIENYKTRIGIDLAQTTFYKYQRVQRYIQEFLGDKKKLKNIPVSRVDLSFIDEFYLFLRKEIGNCQNSSVALLHCLKSILNDPLKKGVIRVNPFNEFKFGRVAVNRDYLTMEEIKSLQQLEGLNEAVERNRDLFLFACYTGLAYSDIVTLKSIHVVEDDDGSCSIRKARQKSKQMSFVPLLPAAEKILKKYSPTGKCSDFQWKVVSNQKLNQSLKEIAKKAGIEKKLFMHLGRHTFATTVTLSNGVPIETVGKMLGHSTLKHTQIYAKVVASKVKLDMQRVRELMVEV